MKRFLFFAALALLSVDGYCHDWANLACYREANDSVMQLDASQREIVLLGNSITYNWARDHREFLEENHMVGRGISGQTTTHFLARFRQDVLNLKPQTVVVLGGTNDIAENAGEYNEDLTMSNIQSMVELARANGIRPVLCTVLPVTQYWWNKDVPNVQDKIDSLNRRITVYAKENKIPLVDYFTPMAMPDRTMNPKYAEDGVHPNLAGYAVMEKLLLEVLGK